MAQELKLVAKHLEERDLALAEEAAKTLLMEASCKGSTDSQLNEAGKTNCGVPEKEVTWRSDESSAPVERRGRAAEDVDEQSEAMSPVSTFEDTRIHAPSPLPSLFQLHLSEYQDAASTLEKLRGSIQTRPPARLEPQTLTSNIKRDLEDMHNRYSNTRSPQATQTIISLGLEVLASPQGSQQDAGQC
jgi:hypothetical protein